MYVVSMHPKNISNKKKLNSYKMLIFTMTPKKYAECKRVKCRTIRQPIDQINVLEQVLLDLTDRNMPMEKCDIDAAHVSDINKFQ